MQDPVISSSLTQDAVGWGRPGGGAAPGAAWCCFWVWQWDGALGPLPVSPGSSVDLMHPQDVLGCLLGVLVPRGSLHQPRRAATSLPW